MEEELAGVLGSDRLLLLRNVVLEKGLDLHYILKGIHISPHESQTVFSSSHGYKQAFDLAGFVR